MSEVDLFLLHSRCPLHGKNSLLYFSWGSGANPWGPEKEDQFNKPTHYDGNLEVVGITGVVHMAQIHSGLRTGIRVAQGGHVSLCTVSSRYLEVEVNLRLMIS